MGIFCGKFSTGIIFHGDGTFGGEPSRSNLRGGGGGDLTEFLYEILFICLTFSLPTQFCIWICSRGIIRGSFSA